MAVCSIGVSDVNSIPERVFSSAFKIFDQVARFVGGGGVYSVLFLRTRTIAFHFLRPALYSASFFLSVCSRSR